MASMATSIATALYLYGITSADADAATAGGGIDGGEVTTLAEGRIVAIVSEADPGKLRPQRANLAAHHRVLREWSGRQTVLPVVFGTVVGSDDDLRRFLRLNQDALAALLKRLAGCVELGLKVYWDTPNIFEYFVATHQELEQMREPPVPARPGRVGRGESGPG